VRETCRVNLEERNKSLDSIKAIRKDGGSVLRREDARARPTVPAPTIAMSKDFFIRFLKIPESSWHHIYKRKNLEFATRKHRNQWSSRQCSSSTTEQNDFKLALIGSLVYNCHGRVKLASRLLLISRFKRSLSSRSRLSKPSLYSSSHGPLSSLSLSINLIRTYASSTIALPNIPRCQQDRSAILILISVILTIAKWTASTRWRWLTGCCGLSLASGSRFGMYLGESGL
jgi:hypothetical protein